MLHLRPDRRASRLLLLGAPLLLSCALPVAQDRAQEPAEPEASRAFDAGRAWKHLESLVGFGPRPSGSPEIEATRVYLEHALQTLGLATRRERFDAETPEGTITFQNVVAELPGTDPEAPILVLATHFDTKRLPFRFVGANDGGSGTAVLLELARCLRSRKAPVTYRFLFLDGEEALRAKWADEDNCYGSRHHVSESKRKGELSRIGACVLLDMVGDKDLRLTAEGFSTASLLAVFFDAARELGLGDKVGASPRDLKDDHLRFLEAGVPSVDLIDFEYGFLNEHWHAPTDTLENCAPESLDAIGRIVLAGLPAVERFVLAKR